MGVATKCSAAFQLHSTLAALGPGLPSPPVRCGLPRNVAQSAATTDEANKRKKQTTRITSPPVAIRDFTTEAQRHRGRTQREQEEREVGLSSVVSLGSSRLFSSVSLCLCGE